MASHIALQQVSIATHKSQATRSNFLRKNPKYMKFIHIFQIDNY